MFGIIETFDEKMYFFIQTYFINNKIFSKYKTFSSTYAPAEVEYSEIFISRH